MKVFVTGATGYIGGAVVEKLLAAGHRVLGLASSEEAVSKLQGRGIEPHRGDLSSPESLARGAQEADAAIHTALWVDDFDNAMEAEHNVVVAVLEVLAGTGKPFILTSSSGILGDTGDRIFDEETPFTPPSSFTAARASVEQEVLHAATHGVRSVVLRSPVVYGRGGSKLIPAWLLREAPKSGVSRYIVGTGENKWSVVHVDDLADLYVLALERASAGTLFHTSAEWGVTTRAIAEAVSHAAGLGGKTETMTKEEAIRIWGELWADYFATTSQSSGNKAVRLLGWKPQRRSLVEDVEHGSYRFS